MKTTWDRKRRHGPNGNQGERNPKLPTYMDVVKPHIKSSEDWDRVQEGRKYRTK